jgi:hypothetical protein
MSYHNYSYSHVLVLKSASAIHIGNKRYNKFNYHLYITLIVINHNKRYSLDCH